MGDRDDNDPVGFRLVDYAVVSRIDAFPEIWPFILRHYPPDLWLFVEGAYHLEYTVDPVSSGCGVVRVNIGSNFTQAVLGTPGPGNL